VEFARARTAGEIEAVQQLRYQVYVEEMHRYDDVAGADEGRFAEPEDAYSWICYARDGADVVAASRLTWGGDGFSPRQVAQYQLTPFLSELPAEVMGVGERITVLPEYRGTGVLEQLLAFAGTATWVNDLNLVFGCCEPHLVPLYLKLGQRTYAAHHINSPAAGYLIPLVAFVPDVEALRGLGPATPRDELPSCIQDVLRRAPSVRSEVLTPHDDYWSEIRRTLDELEAQRISPFDGLSEAEAQRLVARSTIIECEAGDRVLKRGGTGRNVFVVLDGAVEVRDGEAIVNVLTAGDAFGEMAFLLERPRSFDVDAAVPGTRVLSLSERALRVLIAEDAAVAAKLLLNLSRHLCLRLIKASSPHEP
jgi:CRP-like cAMP-binding protein/GNAT superfamily N-acetyltransferase